MKKIFLFICLFCIIDSSSQNEKVKPKKLKSSFEENLGDSSSVYNDYSKQSSNNIHYNTGYGESKYDKDINWDADINPNDVKGSLEKFRTKKRNEEIIWYSKIALGLLFVFSITYFIFKFIKKN
jgi:hypothetical protein